MVLVDDEGLEPREWPHQVTGSLAGTVGHPALKAAWSQKNLRKDLDVFIEEGGTITLPLSHMSLEMWQSQVKTIGMCVVQGEKSNPENFCTWFILNQIWCEDSVVGFSYFSFHITSIPNRIFIRFTANTCVSTKGWSQVTFESISAPQSCPSVLVIFMLFSGIIGTP